MQTSSRRRVSTANERNLTLNYLAGLIDNQLQVRRTPPTPFAISQEDYRRSQQIIGSEGSVTTLRFFGVPRTTKFMGRRVVDRHNNHAMFMGLEIEGAPLCSQQSALNDYLNSQADLPENRRIFGIKTDGSLISGYNCELYTARATLSMLRNNVASIMENMADKMHTNPTMDLMAAATSSAPTSQDQLKQYGMHCHIGWQCLGLRLNEPNYTSSDVTISRTGYVLTALFRHLNTLARKIGGRPKTRWCVGAKSSSIRSLVDVSHQRGAINTFTRHGTVEFRFGRGKFDYQHTVGYIELCHAMFKLASQIVAENLDHMAVCTTSSLDLQWYNPRAQDFYSQGAFMVWSKEREKLQRKAINIMFHDYVLDNKQHYEVLAQLVDAYYQGEGKHFIKPIAEALVEQVQPEQELAEEAC